MTTAARPPATDDAPPADRAWLVWGGIVVGFLCFTLLTQGILILYATSDPSVAVEPDYYRKAVAWDEHRAQLAKNQALGWRIEVEAGRLTPAGERALEVRLLDRAGAALPGAQVQLRAFHKARRAHVLQTTCPADRGGHYAALLPLRRRGLHELRFVVTREGERFTQVVEQDLPGPTP